MDFTVFLIVIDTISKWTEICMMNASTDSATIEKLRGIFPMHGLLVFIVSDNDLDITSDEFLAFSFNF